MRGGGVQFRAAEVREVVRLANALHGVPPDPTARKIALVERLCGVLGCDAGVCVVTQGPAGSGGAGSPLQSPSVSVVRYGMNEEDAWKLAARYRSVGRPGVAPRDSQADAADASRCPPRAVVSCGAPRGNGVAAGGGYCAGSLLEVPGLKAQACLALLRRRPSRPFTPRERVALDLVHSEMVWVYGPDLPAVSPDGLPLSPRQRQTLQLLLAGNSEKEIAGQLDLSHNTVHHYVKAIHRHLNVSSRSELLARWVRK